MDSSVGRCTFSYYTSRKYKNCCTVFIYAYVQIFCYVPYVHTQLALPVHYLYTLVCMRIFSCIWFGLMMVQMS